MLRSLHISNYALIRSLDIDFNQGMSVLTGETGAGKSIILGAMGLIMGNRADSRSISNGEQKCVVEAEFSLDNKFEAFFSANDLDFEQICTIRRELAANGKSRAFINDTPVSLPVLKQLAEQLIDIHSQHENLLLKDDSFQLSVVDSMADNSSERADYADVYNRFRLTEKEYNTLIERSTKSKDDIDYVQYQYDQLQKAQLRAGEETELEQEQQLLEHAEEVKSALMTTTSVLSDDQGVIETLKESLNNMRHVEAYLPKDMSLTERLQSAYIELRDISDEASRIADNTDYDPLRLNEVRERLDLINNLLQKHHCQTVSQLLELKDELEEQLGRVANYDGEIERLRKQLAADREQLTLAADRLTKTRKKAGRPVKEQLEYWLRQLGIAHARIQVEFQKTDFSADGADFVKIMFAANLNQQPREVALIASGGEMARLMLCIKYLMAKEQALPTIIFDEIDTGVSGEVASNMGQMIAQMAAERQVLCITHLPQIAVKGATHYKVYKEDTAERTETHIRLLNQDERVKEVATLLSGENITAAAIENAKELLNETFSRTNAPQES